MSDIISSEIVKNEISRIRKAPKDFQERDVEYDISLLKIALEKINKLLNGSEKVVFIDYDMWEECHNSLDTIVYHYNLRYGTIDVDNNIFSIVK